MSWTRLYLNGIEVTAREYFRPNRFVTVGFRAEFIDPAKVIDLSPDDYRVVEPCKALEGKVDPK